MYKALKRYRDSGQHKNLAGSGRKRSSTPRQDRQLVRACLQDRLLTLPELKQIWEQAGIHTSTSTISRRLKASGISSRVAKKKPLLTSRHRNLRLDFTRQYSDWSCTDWSTVIWSDEKRFTLHRSDGSLRVRRRSGEMFLEQCVQPTVKFGGGSVMVWACMSSRGTGLMAFVSANLNSAGYLNILSNFMVPSAHLLGYGNHFFYQDDGAPCHRSKIVVDWKKENNIKCLQWPSQSPDLNPIENLWTVMARKVGRQQLNNKTELMSAIQSAWDEITPQTCRKLVYSMPRRISAVKKARGGHTKY